MKNIIVGMFLWCVIATSAFAEKTLHVITDPWPPYIIDENRQQAGFEYQVMQEVLQQLGYSMSYQSYPWRRAIVMMKTQQADAILGIFKSDEREAYLWFPDTAFVETAYVFFVRNDQPFNYMGLKSLTGKRIGIIRGYYYTDEFDTATNFEKDPVPSLKQNLKKLVSGRIDLVIDNRDVGLYVAKQLGLVGQIEVVTTPLTAPQPHYVAFAKKPGYKELTQRFSEALHAFKQTERYQEILNQYGI